MRTWIVAVLALAACSKKSETGGSAGSGTASSASGDDCQRFVDKARPYFQNMAKASGKPFDDKVAAQLVTRCREMKKQGKTADEKAVTCVLGAKDEAGVTACLEAAFGAYKAKAQVTEAEIMLNRIGKGLKAIHAETSAYPKGSVPLTPAQDCCATSGKCPVDAAAWSNPIWQEIDFTIDEPHTFRYSYESADGAAAVVTAVGDLDCDGTTIMYMLDMKVQDGVPTMRISKPDLSMD